MAQKLPLLQFRINRTAQFVFATLLGEIEGLEVHICDIIFSTCLRSFVDPFQKRALIRIAARTEASQVRKG